MTKVIFLFFCFTLSINLFAQTKWLSYEKDNCRLAYPPGWYDEPLTDDLTALGMEFMLMAPLDGKNDKFSENLSLAYEEKKAPITLQQYISATTSILESLIDKFKMKSKTTKINSGGEYACIEYTGLLNNYKLQWMQCVWIKGINIYILSFTAEQSAYKKYKPLFVTMSDSFIIKSN